MKKSIFALALFQTLGWSYTATQAQAIEIDDELLSDGQVLSVQGHRNMMPGPHRPTGPRTTGAIRVSFVAFSGGCTSEESFEVSIEKVKEKTFEVKADRIKVDPCEAVVAPQVYTVTVSAPIEAFKTGTQFIASPGTHVYTTH